MKEFKSILKDEMNGYIRLCKAEGKSIDSIESGIRSLDTFLISINHDVKELSREVVENWIKQLHPPKKTTLRWNVIVVRQLFSYLHMLGITVFTPDVPFYRSDHVPYTFSDRQLDLLFSAADILPYSRETGRESAIQFSVCLRILYGCGLRSGEAVKLRECDIDFSSSFLTIRCAKGKKDRIAPMHDSLAMILKAYTRQLAVDMPHSYLFSRRNGKPRNVGWVYSWFQRTLSHAELIYGKEKFERAGPCPYSMRHAFIHRAYRQYSQATGQSFDDIMPFLSAYVGHENANGTDRYFRYDSSLYEADNELVDSLIDELLPGE